MIHGILPSVLLAMVGLSSPAAQQYPMSPEVVVVYSGDGDAVRHVLTGVRKRLGERGAVTREVRASDGPGLEGLRERRPGVIVVVGGEAADRVRRDFSSIPSVSVLVPRADAPRGLGTGVTMDISWETQVQWLRKLLPPNIKRVGIVYSPANEKVVLHLSDLARSANLRIVAKPAATPGDIPQALSALASSADVLWGIPDEVVMTPETARSILLYSMRNRIPLIGQSMAWVKAGALLALDRDYADMGAQGADQALRLVAGESATSVRPEGPRRVLYAVNARTAEALGVELEADVVRSAREVFR